jgi:glycosyltransferase involved in cell wall biosynthesis
MDHENHTIKVVHLVTRMNTGGVAVLISELVVGLDPERFESYLITGRCSDGEENYLQARGLNLDEITIPSMSRRLSPFADLKSFVAILQYLHKLKPDIVHTHTSKAGLLGRVAARIAAPEAKVVHTFHGHLLHGYFSRIATQFLTLTERALARISDLLISMGNEVKKNLLDARIGNEGQFVVAFPGVKANQPNLSNPKVVKFKSDHNSEVVFTFVGRLSPIKRCDRILELASMKEICDASIHFLIIGDGELRDSLENLGVGLPITFIGWESHTEDWLASSDAAILLSDNEAVPLAMIEAGFAGLPAVATNVGSMSDVVINEVNGFLVGLSAEEIAQRVILLASDPVLRHELGLKGKALASERFSVQAMITKHEEIYSKLMDSAY